MGKVVVKMGDIFEGGMDVTVLPCSKKGSIATSTQTRLSDYGLASPLDLCLELEHGEISDPIPYPHKNKKTKYYMYAASVFNKQSSYDIVKGIGAKIGEVAASNSTFKYLETPLLGAGAGRISPLDSGRALNEGFLTTADDESTLFIFTNNYSNYKDINDAISAGSEGRLFDTIDAKPGIFGFTIDLKKLAIYLKKLFKCK